MLTIQDLHVAIGPVEILRRVNLAVAGEVACGIIGRNGAGKTTLLRAIMGLLRPTQGVVLIDGHDVTTDGPARRAQLGVGYMPEDRRLIPDLTVRANITLPMDVNTISDPEGRLREIFALIPELVPLADRKGSQLSGGQQKLAALGRAIGYGHRMLLLDEPFEGVAPALVRRLSDVLYRLRDTGRMIVISASEGSHIEDLCDIRYQIERGEVRPFAALRPQEVLERRS